MKREKNNLPVAQGTSLTSLGPFFRWLASSSPSFHPHFVRHPSSVVRCLSFDVRCLSSGVCRLSIVVCRSTFDVRPPSSVVPTWPKRHRQTSLGPFAFVLPFPPLLTVPSSPFRPHPHRWPLAPAIHPTSSGSQSWGRVLGLSSSMGCLCPGAVLVLPGVVWG